MNQTYVHMHDGESVYYEDTCFVCEAKNDAPDETVTDDPWTVVQSVELKDEPVPYRRSVREFTFYELRDILRSLAWLGAVYAIWILGFILLSLLLHGTVKW